jgi:NADH-quinone oxidoreductase subunit E
MAWIAENRASVGVERSAAPLLSEEMKTGLAARYFPRYPTKRAALLPVLHAVQHRYGWIAPQAMEEVAAFLEIAPAEVMDVATFYEEYWLKPKGKYLIAVCRSLACELCGATHLTAQLKAKLGVEAGQTTKDGKFTLVEYECLGACGGAPAALCNDVLHENLTLDNFQRVLDALPDDPAQYKDPSVNWDDKSPSPL